MSGSASDDVPDHVKLMKENAPKLMSIAPYAAALGMELIDFDQGVARMRAPYREDLVGDPETGVIHGGVVTALLDNCAGVAVISALQKFKSTATLDLRIDYMRPGERGRDIIGEAECYNVTKSVAFVRAWAYHDSKDRVIATAAGAFALNDPGGWAKMANKAKEALS